MDCYVLSSGSALSVGINIGLGLGGAAGFIVGRNGWSHAIIPPSVQEMITPLQDDLEKIFTKISELKRIPGLAAEIEAINATSKTGIDTITRMEQSYFEYIGRVRKLEEALKDYPHVWLLLTAGGRRLRQELTELKANIGGLKGSVDDTTTRSRKRNLDIRIQQQGGGYSNDGTTSENSSLMEILGQERETPLHLPHHSRFSPMFYDQPGV